MMATPPDGKIPSFTIYAEFVHRALTTPNLLSAVGIKSDPLELVTRPCSSCGVRYFSLSGWFNWQCSDCRPQKEGASK